MWNWVKQNKDSITAVAAIVQTLAVAGGILFAVNEFIIKDRTAKQHRINTTLEIMDSSDEFDDAVTGYFWDIIGKTDEEFFNAVRNSDEFLDRTMKTGRLYSRISACRLAEACDDKLLKRLFCSRAFADAFVMYKFWVKHSVSSLVNYDLRLDDLFLFAKECVSDGLEYRSPFIERSLEWDPELRRMFEKFDAAATERSP